MAYAAIPNEPEIQLADLGPRICILGGFNTGKSTLANAISRKTSIPAVHLDQLYFLPIQAWQPRPKHEFSTLQAAAIAQDAWVIDGMQRLCLAERLERATSVIMLDGSVAGNLYRYLRRTLLDPGRLGAPEGAPERLTWEMLKWILWTYPRYRRPVMLELYREITLPKVYLPSAARLDRQYEKWGLTR